MLSALVMAVAIDCIFPPICQQPSTPSDPPSCEDSQLDDALIANAQHGDRSAVELLQQRYATAFTTMERFRIGGALLGRVADDSTIWNELSAQAETLLLSEEKPAAQRAIAWEALGAIVMDRRARPLLLRALTSADPDIADAAKIGLAMQDCEDGRTGTAACPPQEETATTSERTRERDVIPSVARDLGARAARRPSRPGPSLRSG
jgi:hypothetical protein